MLVGDDAMLEGTRLLMLGILLDPVVELGGGGETKRAARHLLEKVDFNMCWQLSFISADLTVFYLNLVEDCL